MTGFGSRHSPITGCNSNIQSARPQIGISLMQDLVIIEPGRGERHYWLELWRYRELFRVLAWRDLSVRYKQTVIGVLWALIRPFMTMVIFTILFGRIAQLP